MSGLEELEFDAWLDEASDAELRREAAHAVSCAGCGVCRPVSYRDML